MREEFFNNILNGFCDFITGDILTFRHEDFRTDYRLICKETIASRIFFKMLLVQFIHSYCVKTESRPYCDINIGVLLQQTLISELHNSSYFSLLTEQDTKEKIAKDVLNFRLTGLDGATKEDFITLWLHTFINAQNPGSQIITLSERLADIFLALEEMMIGNRRAQQYINLYVKKLETESFKGVLVDLQKWFVNKFTTTGDE